MDVSSTNASEVKRARFEVSAAKGPAPGTAFIGTSGWAYASWKPGFYPPRLPAKKFLEHYSSRLNTVEVNYTFRALPTDQMRDNWLAATGASFRFSFKAPQRITHMLRLKNCEEALTNFVAALEPVTSAGRMGAVLFQLPPNFKADAARLDDFLTLATTSSPGLKLAFEFRHQSWFEDPIYNLLRQHNAALCVAESDELATPFVLTAGFGCFRFRKSTYTEEELVAIAAQLRAQVKSTTALTDVFAYFKHEDEPCGPLRAEAMLKQLARQ